MKHLALQHSLFLPEYFQTYLIIHCYFCFSVDHPLCFQEIKNVFSPLAVIFSYLTFLSLLISCHCWACGPYLESLFQCSLLLIPLFLTFKGLFYRLLFLLLTHIFCFFACFVICLGDMPHFWTLHCQVLDFVVFFWIVFVLWNIWNHLGHSSIYFWALLGHVQCNLSLPDNLVPLLKWCFLNLLSDVPCIVGIFPAALSSELRESFSCCFWGLSQPQVVSPCEYADWYSKTQRVISVDFLELAAFCASPSSPAHCPSNWAPLASPNSNLCLSRQNIARLCLGRPLSALWPRNCL